MLLKRKGVVVGGDVVSVKEIITKKGDPMAFLDLIHRTNQYSCTIFPNVYDTDTPYFHLKEPLIVRGRKDNKTLSLSAQQRLKNLRKRWPEQTT